MEELETSLVVREVLNKEVDIYIGNRKVDKVYLTNNRVQLDIECSDGIVRVSCYVDIIKGDKNEKTIRPP